MTTEVVLVERRQGVGTVILHRPEARNALNNALRRELRLAVEALEQDPDVSVIVLTGADPAFCAGLDLKELGQGANRTDGSSPEGTASSSPFPARTKPLIGAVNGAAITGGFELALNCDFLIASERAVFADTHARVGVMPGWGLTALLADAVGVRRAREISLSGNFVTATEALAWGLVNRVVAHDELLPTTYRIAGDIVANDPVGVGRMLATYAAQEAVRLADAWRLETEGARAFRRQVAFSPAEVEARRRAIVERGRNQLG
jgi:enoyl-CoA hydratase